MDGHSSCRSVCKNKNPAGAGFCLNSVKLTGKPPSVHGKRRGRSFILPFCLKNKNPAGAGFCLNSVKLTGKPGSVVDSHSSRPAIAHWLKQPTRVQYGPYLVNPYLALLRVEFTVPRTVASRAVRSYRTLSPLPDPICIGHRRFALCCTGRGLASPRRYLAPCPMEPGLSSPLSVSPQRRTATKRRLSGQLRREVYRVFICLSLALLPECILI
ncbi:hypothetical protein LA635_2829 [Erwinia amylovora LA635]|nr:hypothetical protein LA635_2829 [Erwinia amylovora LA635]CDK19820.1 hypothetical protein LA636_2828 [Erwinia amylovora LA636]CDK23191.1 hypothetical protein LA637_2831 [Erwinia amylovora LA637]